MRVNPHIREVLCSRSGQPHDPEGFTRPLGLCRCCSPPGKPLVVRYDLPAAAAAASGHDPRGWRGGGLARFEPVLPVQGLPAGFADEVGGTTAVPEPCLGGPLEVDLWLKNEGGNPSGSFKDRGLAVGIALGAACGARRFCLPTQGNAGVAASLFAARLGIEPCLVYMPERWRGSIYHRSCEFFGAEVHFAGAQIAEAGRAMRDRHAVELADGSLVDLSTFFEPGRLEGKKTMGYELFEQFGPGALPDWIIYPTGGGTGLVGIWKAFEELVDLGVLAREGLPRMVVVQARRCAPVAEALVRGDWEVTPVQSRGTVADGLDVPGAIMGHEILRVVRDSGGTAATVSEAAIRAAFGDYGRRGICAGYESAATLAALRRLRSIDVIPAGSRVVLLNTASHLVQLARLQEAARPEFA